MRGLAALLLSGLVLILPAACGDDRGGEAPEPRPEGAVAELGGIDYTVDLARQLNTSIPPDSDYFQGPGAPPGSLYFGVFLHACNRGGAPRSSAERLTLVDAFGNRLKPKELPDDNVFAYEARDLAPGECIPREGSAAARAAPGAMLLFEVPHDVFRNRPLKLRIQAPSRKESVSLQLGV
ncbi:MAG: hypothetical protein M3N16_02225 [Actinomycetota bacterium]|nr:hypothetical protein [Actinomycetota bacterium]